MDDNLSDILGVDNNTFDSQDTSSDDSSSGLSLGSLVSDATNLSTDAATVYKAVNGTSPAPATTATGTAPATAVSSTTYIILAIVAGVILFLFVRKK